MSVGYAARKRLTAKALAIQTWMVLECLAEQRISAALLPFLRSTLSAFPPPSGPTSPER